jgi:hypothetical protein
VFTFAQATLWDRAFGSSTIIIHIEGSNTPGAPALPECIKADVYLPPVIISEHPEAHSAIAQIVQTFIEAVGVPTIQRWTCAGKKRGWPLSQSGHIYKYLGSSTRPLVPSPNPGTSHYQFHGRPYGSLPVSQAVQASDHSHTNDYPVDSHAQPTTPQESERCSSEPLSPTTLSFLESIEKIAMLKAQVEAAELREDSLLQQIHTLFDRLQNKDKEIRELQVQLANRNSWSMSDFSSISNISSRPQSPEHGSPSKRSLQRDLALKFPTIDTGRFPNVDSSLFPKPVPMRAQPFSPRSPAAQQASRNADNPFLHSASPSSSRGRYRGQTGQAQAQPLPLSSYVDAFLQEYGLQEKFGDSIALIYNMPVPAWFKLVNSLDLTDDQRGELIAALTNDW